MDIDSVDQQGVVKVLGRDRLGKASATKVKPD
jgi:hypothetical protein